MKKLMTVLFVVTLSAAVATAQVGAVGAPGSQAPGQGSQAQTAPQDENQSATSMGQNQSSMSNTDDESLHRQVHEQLASNPDLQNVQITVNKGVVTLEGSVPNKADKKEAAKLAKSVPGVKRVKDKLAVSASASAAAPSSTGGVSAAATGQNASAEAENGQNQAAAGAVAGQAGQVGQTSPTTGTTSGAATSSEMGQSQMGQMGQAQGAANAGQPCSAMSGSQAGAAGAAAGSSDVQQIQSSICAEPSLASSNVTVSEQGNQIILSGTVSSIDAKDKASDIAMKYANGKTLVNNIQVSGGATAAAPPSAGGISGQAGAQVPPAGQQEQQPGISGQAGAAGQVPPAEQQGGVSGQAGAAGQVPPAEQQQPGISGQAGAAGQTPEAGAQAGAQPGTASESNDEQLRSQIQTALQNEPSLANSNINVNVTADSVELSGSVPKGKDRQTAKRIAESFAGNRKVVDHITVSGQGGGMNNPQQPPK